MAGHEITDKQETEQILVDRERMLGLVGKQYAERSVRCERKFKSHHARGQVRHTSVQILDDAGVTLGQPVAVQPGRQKEMRGLSDCAQGPDSAAMR